MYQYAPMTSANGNSANIDGRSSDFFGTSTLSGPGLGGGPSASFTSASRPPGFKALTSGGAAWPKGDASFASPAGRPSRCTLSSRTPAPSCAELVASFSLFSRLTMTCPFLSRKRRIACLGQVLFQRLQRFQETLCVVFGHANHCFSAGDIVVFTRLFQFGARSRHEMEKPSAAISRMRVPFDQPQCLQLVDDATKRDRFDFDKLSESRLINALVLREVGQNLPLRSGET